VQVGYVENEYIHCPVKAEVIDPRNDEVHISNVFQFTFRVNARHKEHLPPQLNFSTYQGRFHHSKVYNVFVAMGTDRAE
jgi:hypothetical protein